MKWSKRIVDDLDYYFKGVKNQALANTLAIKVVNVLVTNKFLPREVIAMMSFRDNNQRMSLNEMRAIYLQMHPKDEEEEVDLEGAPVPDLSPTADDPEH